MYLSVWVDVSINIMLSRFLVNCFISLVLGKILGNSRVSIIMWQKRNCCVCIRDRISRVIGETLFHVSFATEKQRLYALTFHRRRSYPSCTLQLFLFSFISFFLATTLRVKSHTTHYTFQFVANFITIIPLFYQFKKLSDFIFS